MTSGIYEIVHIPSGCRYIGHSKHIEWRWWQHRGNLDQGLHVNVHLQRAWRRYGCDAFIFRVVETCSESMLLEREQAYIDLYWETPGALYNIARKADRPPSAKGRIYTEEQRRKNSSSKLGKPKTEEHRANIAAAKKGKHPTEETRKKLSIARRARVILDSTRAKLSASLTGKIKSEEHRANLAAAGRGRPVSEETRAKIAESNRLTRLKKRGQE